MREALRASSKAYREYDWRTPYSTGNLIGMRMNFLRAVNEFQPTHIFMQLQTPDVFNSHFLKKINAYKINWCGDVRNDLPQWCREIALDCNLNLFTNMRDVDTLRGLGANAEYMNIGFSDKVFTPNGDKVPSTQILFMGNNYVDRFPFSGERVKMVDKLTHKFKHNFQVHGGGWWRRGKWVPEYDEAGMYRNCTIAIGQNHYRLPRFASDRIFRATGSGAFLIHNHYEGIEQDFVPDKEIVVWHEIKDLMEKVEFWLKNHDERIAIAKAGCERSHRDHTWKARIDWLQKHLGVA
jgi:spore maturation protein CgeB